MSHLLADAQLWTWAVGVTFYSLGAVCAWNLYATWHNWRQGL